MLAGRVRISSCRMFNLWIRRELKNHLERKRVYVYAAGNSTMNREPFPFRFRLHPNLAAVGFHYLLRDVEAVTGGVNVCFYRLFSVSAFSEEILHIFRGNADAVVLH